MSRFLVNGHAVEPTVEPRTHLADFVRDELLLTATHLGCEQGVCGACTVLIDGAPARSCLIPAALCAGRQVQTLEGLETDPVIVALRDAFSAEHALQCGYCTPGMLITARDIVLRLPAADEALIRLELAGNLCRCTGYAGIVKAIRRVLDQPVDIARPETAPAAPMHAQPPAPAASPTTKPPDSRRSQAGRDGARLTQTVRIGLPAAALWQSIRNPALIASCVPGATLDHADGETITGTVLAALGPIRASFSGSARLLLDDAQHTGKLEGSGRDAASGTILTGDVAFAVVPDGIDAARLTLTMDYSLRGPLAQFGRRPIVEALAAELVEQTALTLEARLRGEESTGPVAARPIGTGLLLGAAWRLIRRLFSMRT